MYKHENIRQLEQIIRLTLNKCWVTEIIHIHMAMKIGFCYIT